MASRLFQAVVGFGISMGVASVGCGGEVAPASPPDAFAALDTEASDTFVAPDTFVPDTSVAPDSFAPDSAIADSADAIVDAAFCDAPWPTTKGSPPIPVTCIDPTGACASLGGPIECGKPIDTYTCEHARWASNCVGGAWRCPDGLKPVIECKCFGTPPPGYVCTAMGLQMIADAAADSGGAD